MHSHWLKRSGDGRDTLAVEGSTVQSIARSGCHRATSTRRSSYLKRVSGLGALLWLSCVSAGAHAEGNCPAGFYPIGGRATAGCAPIPGNGGGHQQASKPPAPVWEDRWGAIAGDKPQGILGFSTAFPSEPAAQQAALADCASKGGSSCKIENSYKNGCTAMIVGERVYNIASRATVDEAIASGIQKCEEVDRNCVASYSACSPPVRIR